ncbi:FAD-dependent monooxygenase [Amycolatopsis suaedae]|uniref:FAD-binding monooxygenase n=1 Tax=Amycolatopsis suaedae TaxID=2510978 RepID=A0A4Q7J3Z0_9PSEU|nr:FAD-dependent monooxygenase [Amycolatopsis suaedae]RZQ61697.1 FAD-binding monooxygenase [Amycolatopsis suaedae]
MSNVLISGAGIAGPALAYWLHRHGFRPTVVERAAEPRRGGQAVDLRGVARDVVERMGILDLVRERHTGVRGTYQVDDRDRPVLTWPADLLGDSGGIIAEIEILRSDLARILREATPDGVEYVFGDTVTGLVEDADGVNVTFAHGPARRFDLVVGADGVRSTVRNLAFGPDTGFLTDNGYYTAVFTTRSPVDLGGWQRMHNLVGSRMAGLYPVGDGDEARAVMMFACPPIPHDRRDVVAQRRIVADAFADAGWLVPELLNQMSRASDFYFDRSERVSVDRWWRGRVTLLGDSLSGGSVGMGTSMAIVGAYVLAGELAAAGGDHEVAFPRYQSALAEYVRENQKPMPGGLKAFLPRTRPGIALRNLVSRAMLAGPWRGMVTGMQAKSEAVTLRDYEGRLTTRNRR